MVRVLENPRSGERFVIHRTGAETNGHLLEFEVFLQPHAHVPAMHAHPNQEERFTVVSGNVRFRVAGKNTVLGPGDSVTVSSGTSHWFGNVGDGVAQLRVEVRPALRMEELFETTVRCADSDAGVWFRRMLDWALILLDFRGELAVPNVPTWLVTASLSPLAWLRQRLLRVSGT
ncbi:MAG: cupin domain-containing protein [Chloroflexi bacterium]|nr:cupin domain-containing protein [Chloroflexota bacterium]MBV9895984.1 cupin domain-containing protein [Chloroflexota bacterium]